MRVHKNKFVATAASLAVAASSIAAVQLIGVQPASAAACLSTANGHGWAPTASTTNSKSPTWTTTVNCVDINFRVGSVSGGNPVGKIRVCFVGAGYCQSSWKTLNSSGNPDVLVVATNVADNTTYKLEIDWTGGYGNSIEAAAYA